MSLLFIYFFIKIEIIKYLCHSLEFFSTLGIKVADYIETTEFLSSIWLEYLDGKCSIRKVIAEYRKNGFQGIFLKSYDTHFRAVF